jgi:hypothetical protein
MAEDYLKTSDQKQARTPYMKVLISTCLFISSKESMLISTQECQRAFKNIGVKPKFVISMASEMTKHRQAKINNDQLDQSLVKSALLNLCTSI